jgi:AcrR family transcriptional regulator
MSLTDRLKTGRSVRMMMGMAATPLRERTRQEILRRAMELFAEKGYAATSLQDIATAAGCSKATVLYHFNGKPAVVAAVLEPAAKLVAELVAEASQLPPAKAQARLITEFTEIAVRFRGLLDVLNDLMPTMDQLPEFQGLVAVGAELTRLLAGTDDPREIAMAGYAIQGLLGECRAPVQRTDEDLRDLAVTAMRRLLITP